MSHRPKPRRTGTRDYRIRVFIVVEGETEQQYFRSFSMPTAEVSLECLTPDKGSDPRAVLDTLERILERARAKGQLRSGDPAWAVIDRDNWTESQINELFQWAYGAGRKDRGVGFSDPQFEFWILLHFSDGAGGATQQDCLSRLSQYIPNYQKAQLSQLPLTLEEKQTAVTHGYSRLKDEPKSLSELTDVPRGITSVHFLVEKLLKLEKGDFQI